MDFKTLVNKDSFKAILLHHLKAQIKTKFGNDLSRKIKDIHGSEELIFSEELVSSISKDFLNSLEFPQFAISFEESIQKLLEDDDKYIPKNYKQTTSSQCSSASSVNTSSIDFLSPERFHYLAESLNTGTNAEKLEALGTLYRLPTLEPIIVHLSTLENGLYGTLSSNINFLKDQTLGLYIKMLTCPEPKVVQESYLSLIKYLLEVSLPRLSDSEIDVNRYSCTVEIVSVLNKFLQNISTHWLRYPQSMIEKITTNSLRILLASRSDSLLPVWSCFAKVDPEAKYLKSLLHGHTSRASFLDALQENLEILLFAVGLCEKFYSEEEHKSISKSNCCDNPYVSEITHTIIFLSHLLQYTDGRAVLSCVPNDNNLSCWTNILSLAMKCTYKLCYVFCFNCCVVSSDILSEKWCYFRCCEAVVHEHLLEVLVSSLNKAKNMNITAYYFTIGCFHNFLDSVYSTNLSDKEKEINISILKLLNNCIKFYDCSKLLELDPDILYLFNLILVFLKSLLSNLSVLFFELDFISVLSQWVKIIMTFNDTNKHKLKTVPCIDKNILDIFISLLEKPFGTVVCYNSCIYEEALNMLLEKIMNDIKSRRCICPYDIATLITSFSQSVSAKLVLNNTTIFRLSSLIWQLTENSDNIDHVRQVLIDLVPSIFCYLPFTKEENVASSHPEVFLFKNVLLFPNLLNNLDHQEDHRELALLVISHLSTSIQSLCVLQSEFCLTDWLLESQSEYAKIDGREIVCPVAILQNHILVKLYILGGPSEKNLPCEVFENINDSYNWPFVTELPILEIFCPVITPAAEIDGDYFHGNLQSMDLKEIFVSCLKSQERIPYSLVIEFLKKIIDYSNSEENIPKQVDFINLEDAPATLHETELAGISLVKGYGVRLGLISDNDDDKLEQLLKASKHLIEAENSSSFDVFVCTVYLLFRGESNAAWQFLQFFAKTDSAVYVWRELQVSVCKGSSSDCVYLQSILLELCDYVTNKTFPEVFSALEFYGVLPSSIFNSWMQQCYWNYLDFSEISHFVLLTVLFSGEFTIYFFVAVMKHLHHFILLNAHSGDLYNRLLKNTINGFKLCDHVDFICTLSETFHELVSKYLGDFINNQKVRDC